MTYLSNAELPSAVRAQLPSEALDIYRSAFNAAYANEADNPIETADAHNVAWEAVQRYYVEEGGVWVRRGVPG